MPPPKNVLLYFHYFIIFLIGRCLLSFWGDSVNIRDVGNTPDTTGADRVNTQKTPAEPVRAQEEKPVQVEQTKQTEQAEKRHDEYIRSMIDTVQGASYSVFDVRRGKVDGLKARVQGGTYSPDGRKVALKLIDVILSTGRKNLVIYRNEP